MKCHSLTQVKTHKILFPWLKDVGRYPDFEKAFQIEATRRQGNKEKYWSLPENERIYYAISLDVRKIPYLLIGIHSSSFNISSIARVATNKEKMGTRCLKFFFENVFLEKLRSHFPERKQLFAVASTEGGKELFTRLNTDRPRGITGVEVSEQVHSKKYYKVTITYDP